MLQRITPYVLLSVFCLALFVSGLNTLPTTDRDEARYAQATKQMLETGDYIDMRFQDVAYHKKPVGIQWLQVAAVAIAGEDARTEIWVYRIPSVIGAWAAVLLTFALGSRLFDRRTALLGAALLGGSLILVVQAHIASTDAMLLFTVVGAQAVLARLYATARQRAPDEDPGPPLPLWMAIGFWVALAGGILLKGPIAPFVILLTVLALTLFDRDWRWLRGLRPLIGVPLMLVLVLPWFIAIAVVSDGAFFRESVGVDLFAKMVSGQESHGAPPGYFTLLMLLTFWPGSLYVWPALWQAIRTRTAPGVRFCLAWLIPAWIVFEIVPTKLPHYTMPLYPALAMLTAVCVMTVASERRVNLTALWVKILHGLWALPGLVLAVAAVAGPIYFGAGWTAWSLIPAVAGVATSVVTLRLAWRGDVLRATIAGLLLGGVTMVGTLNGILPHLSHIWLSPRIAETVDAVAPDREAPVAIAGFAEPSVVFRLGTDTLLADNGAEAADHLSEHPTAVVLIDERQAESFHDRRASLDLQVRELGEITGLNYSNGQELRLTVYALTP